MNKDVVYIEPEDDITDIIARVKSAKQKLVALVPPKKIGVLRSAVNTKLVAKAARAEDKVVVIVTTDPSLMKLAAAAQIPVAKTLQSRPKLPSEIVEETKEAGEQVIDENDFPEEETAALNEATGSRPAANSNATAKSAPANSNVKSVKPKNKADQEISSDDLEKDNDKDKKKGKKDKKGIPVFEKYRKWFIIGGVVFVVLVIFLIWAFVFAPAANIAVAIRTTTNNFSENVSFVTNAGNEKTTEGIFLLEQRKVEKNNSVEFTATGQKDVGEKAHGVLNMTATINDADGLTIGAGTTFSYGNYAYTTDRAVTFTVGEEDGTACLLAIAKKTGCEMSTTVDVTAANPGADYNIGAHDSGWSTPRDDVKVSNTRAFTGGTSNVVTVVSDDDFKKAKEKLSTEGKEDGKSELAKLFGDDMIIIESSLEQSTSDPKSTPAVGEEVKSGVTPKVEATTTYTLYAVDKNKVVDYVKKKSEDKLASDQKIYAVDTPFFENFAKNNNNYTAKLKSSTQTGPSVSEEDILEKAKGKRVGEIQALLKSINGVSSVSVKTSFFWVKSVPSDPNKITIELKVEE